MTFIPLLFLSTSLLQGGFASEKKSLESVQAKTLILQNITKDVFGDAGNEYFPLAFGDFNSDKLTDIIASNHDQNNIVVLFARAQSSLPIDIIEHTYFDIKELKKKHRSCWFNTGEIVGAVPGDFDGDGGMDVLVTLKLEKGELSSFVLWGSHVDNEHTLVCHDDSILRGWHHPSNTEIRPLHLDFNADYISDIFTSNGSSAGFYIFSSDRKIPPLWKNLSSDSKKIKFSHPHCNAYIDLNQDGNADLFISTDEGFEFWCRKPFTNDFVLAKTVSFRRKFAHVGQAAFADMDVNGDMSIVVPACYDNECSNGTILVSKLSSLSAESLIPGVNDDFHDWIFDIKGEKDNFYYELAPRIGDVNLDGYPDLLIRMKHKITKKSQTHLFLNVQKSINDQGTSARSFILRPRYGDAIPNSVLGTFFDIYEDGVEDIVVVRHDSKGYKMEAYTNITRNSDAYFVKVIILTGSCLYNCKGAMVPYGTNFPGQSICYKSQRPDSKAFHSILGCATQLTQTAHNALQLPYTIFGLGLSPNFLDYLYVNVTNSTTGSKSHVWPQIIPNSQLYVLPYPPDYPTSWSMKLYVTPSRSITLIGLALIGTCGVVLLIVMLLHWKDRREDYKERLEESHRFNFDAM